MSETPSERTDPDDRTTSDEPLPEAVDWILGALIALGGLLSAVGGSTLAFLVDREMLAEAIREDDVTVTVGTTDLTDAEAIEVADAVTSWVGAGLLVVGLGMILFAIGYVVVRHRTHRRYRRGEPISSYGAHAVLGAVVTAAASFLPFSPVLGGGVAGYLERSESDRAVSVGTVAGLLPAVPVLVVLLFVLGGVVSGLRAVDQAGAAVVASVAIFFGLMFVATAGAVLGAIGGYVGGRLADERARP